MGMFTAHDLHPEGRYVACTRCGQTWTREPQRLCPGVPVYGWGKWPEHLLTKKQLSDAGFSVTAKLLPAPAGACWRDKSPNGVMWLYDRNAASPKRVMSDAEKAARKAQLERMRAAWICRRCGSRVERIRWGSGYCKQCWDHVVAGMWAKHVLDQPDRMVILDTETTGLNAGYNEIIQIAVIDGRGRVLLDSYVKPVHPERMYERGGTDRCAHDIHGIDAAILETAPAWPQVFAKLRPLLRDKLVLVYNLSFDHNLLIGDCERAALPRPKALKWLDAMDPYAAWVNIPRRRGGYYWQPLGGGHTALADCQRVLEVLHEMAELEITHGD